MPWKIHFNGQVFGPVSDSDYENIRGGIKTAAQQGAAADFGSILDGVERNAIWTIGAPISFEHLAEE